MPSKVYQQEETAVTFLASGGTVVLTLARLGAGRGRLSAQRTTTAPHSSLYRWAFKTKFVDTPVKGQAVKLFLVGESNSIRPNLLGTADAAVVDRLSLNGLIQIGEVPIVDPSAKSADSTGIIFIPFSKFSIVVWNDSGATMSETNGDHEFSLVPIPDEIQ